MEEDEIENTFSPKKNEKWRNDKKITIEKKRKPKTRIRNSLLVNDPFRKKRVLQMKAILTSDLDESDVIEFTTSIKKKQKLHYQTVVGSKETRKTQFFSYIDDKNS